MLLHDVMLLLLLLLLQFYFAEGELYQRSADAAA
jgi:hypothetical protein